MISPPSLFQKEPNLPHLFFGDRNGAGKTIGAAATALRWARGQSQLVFLLAELNELYRRLENGQMSELEFTAREIGLRDQLDQLQAAATGAGPSAEEKVRQIEPAHAQ